MLQYWSQTLLILILLLLTSLTLNPVFAKITYVSNNSDQDYSSQKYSKPVNSYLNRIENGYERVQYDTNSYTLVITQFNESFQPTNEKQLILKNSDEYPLFGGYYSGINNNYVINGVKDFRSIIKLDLIKVLKFSKDWELENSTEITNSKIGVPFKKGSLRMVESDNHLFIRTCTAVKDSEESQQSSLTLVINETSLDLESIRSGNDVQDIKTPDYFSEDYNQFIFINSEGHIVILDQGTTIPRGAYVTEYKTETNSNIFENLDSTSQNIYQKAVLNFKDTWYGEKATGCSLGGIEYSTNNYIIVGTSVDLNLNPDPNKQFASGAHKNVFVSIMNRTDMVNPEAEFSPKFLTEYGSDITATTPQIVKFTDNKYLVIWGTRNANRSTDPVSKKINYAFIDENGNILGEVKEVAGEISDCKPILVNNKAVWYSGNTYGLYYYEKYGDLSFYTIDENGVFNSTKLTDKVEVSDFTVFPDKLDFKVGSEITAASLNVTLKPDNATYTGASYESENEDIVFVNSDGFVTLRGGVGDTVIKVTVNDKTVTVPVHVGDPIHLNEFKIRQLYMTLKTGQTVNTKDCHIFEYNPEDTYVRYNDLNNSNITADWYVAHLHDNGDLYGSIQGSEKLQFKIKYLPDNEVKIYTLNVEVKDNPPTSFNYSTDSIVLGNIGDEKTLSYSVNPSDWHPIWYIENEAIAQVEFPESPEGIPKVHANGVGETKLIGIAGDKRIEIPVIVLNNKQVTSEYIKTFTFSNSTIRLQEGSSTTVNLNIKPSEIIPYLNIQWNNSNNSIVKLNGTSGTSNSLNGLKEGTSVITAKALGKEAKITVNVYKNQSSGSNPSSPSTPSPSIPGSGGNGGGSGFGGGGGGFPGGIPSVPSTSDQNGNLTSFDLYSSGTKLSPSPHINYVDLEPNNNLELKYEANLSDVTISASCQTSQESSKVTMTQDKSKKVLKFNANSVEGNTGKWIITAKKGDKEISYIVIFRLKKVQSAPDKPVDPKPSQPSNPESTDNPKPVETPTGNVPVYRLYNQQSGEHLYTSDKNENDTLARDMGWTAEGEGWVAPVSGIPVYRLYNQQLADHLYTTDTNEVQILTTERGWQADFDGKPLFYSGGSVPIYRLYHEDIKRHLLTKDENEYNVLGSQGWNQEGIKLNSLS